MTETPSTTPDYVACLAELKSCIQQARQRAALMREPVMIQRQKHHATDMMSAQEYERLARLNVAEFQRFCDWVGASAEKAELTEQKLAALLSGAE